MQIFENFNIGLKQIFDLLTIRIREYILKKFPLICPRCKSKEIVKDGKAKRKNIPDVQMFKCKKCGKKFCERVNTPFYRKKYSEGLIVGVAWFFYERGSINWVVNKFSIEPTYKTIYGWIAELTEYIARIKGEFEIGKCQGDEMFFNACGKRFYICGIWKDGKIFTMPMLGNSSLELYIVLRNAEINLGEIDELHTDAWDGYKNATKWLGIKHRYVNRSKEGFVSKDGVHTNNLECEWSLLRRWLETARRYKKEECFYRILKGYNSYHNFIKYSDNVGKALVYSIIEGYQNFLFFLYANSQINVLYFPSSMFIPYLFRKFPSILLQRS